MALPNFRASPGPPPGAAGPQPTSSQTMMAGSPVSFNILKERLRSSPVGSPGGLFGHFQGGGKMDETRSNPFIQTQYGNNAFNPQRLDKRPMGSSGVPKPPKAPEKPVTPYMRFSKKIWDSVRSEHRDLHLWEVNKILGLMWRELPDTEKQEFQDEYDVEKAEYDKQLAVYKNSPAYQTYQQQKSRNGPVVDDPEPKGTKSGERRIDIQQAEDGDDPDDGLSVKHLAHARFTRNHMLINEIFSETMVPDVRSVVSTSRMGVLKRQVRNLTEHQQKLSAELTQIEDKYIQKKRKFLESSDAFNAELKKHCSKVVDEKKYKEMVAEQVDKLRSEREERARAGAPTPPPPTPPPTDPADQRPVLQPVERNAEASDDTGDKKAEQMETDKAPNGVGSAPVNNIKPTVPASAPQPMDTTPAPTSAAAHEKPKEEIGAPTSGLDSKPKEENKSVPESKPPLQQLGAATTLSTQGGGPSFVSSPAPAGAVPAPPPALMSTPAPPPATTGTPSQPPPTTSQPTAMTPLVPSGPGAPSAPQNQQHPAPLSAPPAATAPYPPAQPGVGHPPHPPPPAASGAPSYPGYGQPPPAGYSPQNPYPPPQQPGYPPQHQAQPQPPVAAPPASGPPVGATPAANTPAVPPAMPPQPAAPAAVTPSAPSPATTMTQEKEKPASEVGATVQAPKPEEPKLDDKPAGQPTPTPSIPEAPKPSAEPTPTPKPEASSAPPKPEVPPPTIAKPEEKKTEAPSEPVASKPEAQAPVPAAPGSSTAPTPAAAPTPATTVPSAPSAAAGPSDKPSESSAPQPAPEKAPEPPKEGSA